jgi:hypothetical protein
LVERGSTQNNFEAISSKISYTGEADFQFDDLEPVLSQRYSYYRLKSADLDGTFQDSKIIAVEHFDEDIPWQISPNPSSDHIALNWNNKFFNVENILIHDLEGKLIANYEVNGKDSFNINTSELAKKSYVVSIQNFYQRKLLKRVLLQ